MIVKKKGKYGAKKCFIGAQRFDSKAEGKRANELMLEALAGTITDLRFQVAYALAPAVVINGRRKPPLRYVADFVYIRDGVEVVEDVKGMLTAVYRIKRHLMKSVHNIDILETK